MSDSYFDEQKNIDTDFVKCEKCGSAMTFDPEKQNLVCEHCGNVITFDKNSDVKELELASALKQAKTWENETKIYRCENCGAKVVIEKNVVSNSCPFCGTSHVVETTELAGLKPNALIPFLLSDEQALFHSKKWSKRRILAPSKFKKSFRADNIKGVYTPCFTFDSLTVSVYRGRVGQRRTRTVGSGKNRRTESYIHWYSISGTLQYFFDDVTISAGKDIPQKNINKLSPFAKEKSCVYEKKFLHGFFANQYDKDINTSWVEAKGIIDNNIKNMIMRKHHADVVDYLNVSTTHQNVTYKYMLMPVYVGNYTYNKKLYNIYINGSTGKVYGKSPLSPLRVGALVLIIAALITLFAVIFVNSRNNQSAYVTQNTEDAVFVQDNDELFKDCEILNSSTQINLNKIQKRLK